MKMERLESRQLMATTVGTGLLAVYFNNSNFTGTSVQRTDAKIYFDYQKTPPPSVNPTSYSVRWTGKIKPSFSELYTFHAVADDGVRLWVNHRLVIDSWAGHTVREDSGTVQLTASTKVDIQVEYWNNKNAATIQLWWSSPSQAKQVVPAARLYPGAQNLSSKVDHAFAFADQQIANTIVDLGNNAAAYPSNTLGSGAPGTNGAWAVTAGDGWTAGFFGGELWQAYQHNPKKQTRLNATAWTKSLANRTSIIDDMGFRLFVPYQALVTGSGAAQADINVLIAAADAKMTQWNSTVGMFRSSGGTTLSTNPAGNYAVLLDHAMDTQVLYWAWKKTGNTLYRDRANAHLLKLAQNYVNSDGSTSQWGYYNSSTGAFVGIEKKQAYSTTSAWARGQGWAIYSYTNAYAQTQNATLLATARKTADYYINHMPADGVPYWDFESPAIPSTYKDTSAAAIAASGLLQLGKIDPDATRRAKYNAAAQTILTTLCSSTYLAEGTTSHGILLHGASYVPRKTPLADNSLIYGDYYFLEALNRYTAG